MQTFEKHSNTMVIEVFKTDVSNRDVADRLCTVLLHHFPGSRITIDLHDCDKVLRIEAGSVASEKVIALVTKEGIACSPLE